MSLDFSTLRTVENYLAEYGNELAQNGYEIIKGNRLKAFKMSILKMDVHETDFGNILKSPQLGMGKLDSVLQHIQNDDYYPSFEDKLTHLFFSACKFHCFQDGNKRIAIALSAQMLILNGFLYCSSTFIREMENISYHVAANNIDKDLLHEIISAFIQGHEDDETLKLKVLHAIADGEVV